VEWAPIIYSRVRPGAYLTRWVESASRGLSKRSAAALPRVSRRRSDDCAMVAPAHGQSHPGTASLACTVACLACEAVRSSSQVIQHTALVAACARGDADDVSVGEVVIVVDRPV
jgi:hypothetical protein